MRIMANAKIKALFMQMLAVLAVCALLAAVLVATFPRYAVAEIFCSFLFAGCAFTFLFYRYFAQQSQMIENAMLQVDAYLDGNHEARLTSDEEGELYRLFSKVNTLAAVLNAHAENETRAKQSLRDTISDISHQLKTPLAALNIYIGILQQETETQPEAVESQKFLALAEQEIDRIDSLVQNLLKIAKLDVGTVRFEMQPQNISDMVESLAQPFEEQSRREQKTLLLSGDENLCLNCDRVWLTEAISNLIKNAFDHTQAGDTIAVTWKQAASTLQIIVKDNGCGIHPEDIYYIFKRFYRSRFSKDTQGVGLGLPLAKAVIEAHNGTITVDSELGAGTTFTVCFLIPTKL